MTEPVSSQERLRASLAELRRAHGLTAYKLSWEPGASVRRNLTEIRMILTEQLDELTALAAQMDAQPNP